MENQQCLCVLLHSFIQVLSDFLTVTIYGTVLCSWLKGHRESNPVNAGKMPSVHPKVSKSELSETTLDKNHLFGFFDSYVMAAV